MVSGRRFLKPNLHSSELLLRWRHALGRGPTKFAKVSEGASAKEGTGTDGRTRDAMRAMLCTKLARPTDRSGRHEIIRQFPQINLRPRPPRQIEFKLHSAVRGSVVRSMRWVLSFPLVVFAFFCFTYATSDGKLQKQAREKPNEQITLSDV